jgi:hypothetical protein
LQGEGQEFESPRLHHLLVRRDRAAPPVHPLGPLIRALAPRGHRPADRWGADFGPWARRGGRTLPTGYVIGLKLKSKIFDFAVLSEEFRYGPAGP